MKRCVLFFLFLYIALFSLCATSLWIPNSLNVGMGNDMWSIGSITYNMDDQLTFSSHVSLSAPIWKMNLDMLAFTNRGWQEGWIANDYKSLGDGKTFSGRYDDTEISFSLMLDLIKTNKYFLKFTPSIGLSIVGNQRYGNIQNGFHKLIKIAPVYLDYETENSEAKLILKGELESGFIFPLGTIITIGTDFHYISKFSAIESIYASIQNNSNFTLSFSYFFAQSYTSWKTQHYYFDYLRGPAIELKIDSGLISIIYFSNIKTKNGYGILSFDILSLFNTSTWKSSDINLAFSRSKQLNSPYYDVKLSIPICNSDFDYLISIRYLADNQSFVDNEAFENPKIHPRYRKSYNSFLAGIRYELKNINPFTPYIDLCTGLITWQVKIQRNMMDDNNIQAVIYPMRYSALIDLELGLKIIPEGFIKTNNSDFQIFIFSGFSFINNPNEIRTYLSDVTDNSEYISHFLMRFGLGIEIGFDL